MRIKEVIVLEAGASNITLSLKLPPPSYARRGGEIIAAQLREVGLSVEVEACLQRKKRKDVKLIL